MPGFNGTGPNGQGPFSGGGRGYCVGSLNVAGQGIRLGRGLRRGFRRRNLNLGTSSDLTVEALKKQSQIMQEEMELINQWIKELETNK